MRSPLPGAGLIEEVSNCAPVPDYSLLKEPEEGRPEYYVLEVKLPGVRSAKTLTLDVGGRSLELNAHPQKYLPSL